MWEPHSCHIMTTGPQGLHVHIATHSRFIRTGTDPQWGEKSKRTSSPTQAWLLWYNCLQVEALTQHWGQVPLGIWKPRERRKGTVLEIRVSSPGPGPGKHVKGWVKTLKHLIKARHFPSAGLGPTFKASSKGPGGHSVQGKGTISPAHLSPLSPCAFIATALEEDRAATGCCSCQASSLIPAQGGGKERALATRETWTLYLCPLLLILGWV